jgi:hypothetical protein
MAKRNINNYILINFLRLILFWLYFLTQSIFCNDVDCDALSKSTDLGSLVYTDEQHGDCRFSVAKNKWFKCISYGNTKNFYVITNDDVCYFFDTCKKIADNLMAVYNIKECVQSCAKINDDLKENFIQYGSYCFYSLNPMESIPSDLGSVEDYEIIPNNGYYILKCNKAEYDKIIDELTFTKCVEGNNCPEDYSYYDYEQHKCLSETCVSINKKSIERTDQKTQCVSECIDEIYFYE